MGLDMFQLILSCYIINTTINKYKLPVYLMKDKKVTGGFYEKSTNNYGIHVIRWCMCF